jgi:tetratricopeptide (TPR) repeat protein
MRFFISVVLCCFFGFMFAKTSTDSLLHELDITLEKRSVFLKEKMARIESLKQNLQQTRPEELFNRYLKIYDEYKSFIYDSAFRYARNLQDIAYDLHDPEKIANGKVKLAFVLVSSGLFNEALDTLRTLRSHQLPKNIRGEYYYLMARTCYDLSDFNRDDFYSTRYNVRGNAYMDSAMTLYPSNSSRYFQMSGLKYLHLRNVVSAQQSFETMINDFKLSDADFAVAASTLSFIYFYNGQPIKSKEMLIKAAIADIRSCTKETLATLNLADMLYKEGDVDNAYTYVKVALEDANFYGARHRKVQVAAVFPIIEGQQLSMVESRRKTLFVYSSAITILSIITIAFAIIIYKQFKNLREAKRIITEANAILTETNHQLGDANKIKEEYIWYYFNTTADYINKLDSLKKSMDLKLMTKKIEDLRFTVDSINIKKEREDLYHNFDLVFLKLFPDFVTIFNSFFKEEDRVVLKEHQLLNTELRIFALFRMGIHDHEKIAKILDYSVTTIYTYKTRIRSKSLLPNEEFDRAIMAIRAI